MRLTSHTIRPRGGGPSAWRVATGFIRLFLAMGAVLVLLAVVLTVSRASFLSGAEGTTGAVVDVQERITDRNTDSSRSSSQRRSRSTVFVPVVTFRDESGRSHRFISDTGTYPPSHAVGDTVEVRYDPDDPTSATLTDFWSLWLTPLIVGVIGIAMLAAAATMYRLRPLSPSDAERLRREGRRVPGHRPRVVVDHQLSVNGANPWRIEVDIDDPFSGGSRSVRSEAFWERPPEPLPEPLPVYVDTQRPARCFVDTSNVVPAQTI